MKNIRSLSLKKSLLVKLVTLFMLVAFLSAFIASTGLSLYEINRAEKAETARLQSIADILAPNLTASLLFKDADAAKELIEPLKQQPSIVTVSVYDAQEQLFSAVAVDEKLGMPGFSELKQLSVPLAVDGTRFGTLIIGADNSQFTEQVTFYVSYLFLIFFIILMVSFFGSIFLSSRFVQPILSLAELAKQVTNTNNYTLRAKKQSQDELGDLATGLNTMLETIEMRDQNLELQVQQRTNELKIANDNLQTQAYKDSLSGLPNRRYLLEFVRHLVSDKYSSPEPFSLLFLDLDGFKEVNDSLGHDAGDILIAEASERLKDAMKGNNNVVARLGGDEFTVLVRDRGDEEEVCQVAESLLSELKRPFNILGEHVHVSASIGISRYPESAETVNGIMKTADMAMYEAKNAGRDCYRFFEPAMQERVTTKRRLLDDMHHAVERGEFELFFQPIVNLENGVIDKAEALIRWNHPVKGRVPPDEFIPVAEESGQINKIGLWVAEQAIRFAQYLNACNLQGITIAINVSPAQFKSGSEWLEKFMAQFENATLGKNAISIEITENMLMTCEPASLDQLMSLKNKGIEVAIDDFGVGYSSLSYLQQLEIDLIKIDRSFVNQLNNDFASGTLCKAMINMAKSLDIRVVAEGIENAHQQVHLTRLGCHYGQGYYFSKPLSQDDFMELLASSGRRGALQAIS